MPFYLVLFCHGSMVAPYCAFRSASFLNLVAKWGEVSSILPEWAQAPMLSLR